MARFNTRYLRFTVVLCAAFLLSGDAGSAQGRHARLSRDLAERVRAGDVREASVIVTGTDAQVHESLAIAALGSASRSPCISVA